MEEHRNNPKLEKHHHFIPQVALGALMGAMLGSTNSLFESYLFIWPFLIFIGMLVILPIVEKGTIRENILALSLLWISWGAIFYVFKDKDHLTLPELVFFTLVLIATLGVGIVFRLLQRKSGGN